MTEQRPEAQGPNTNRKALDAYLEQHRGQFTEEALTEALLKEGYSPEDIRAGFAALVTEDASKPVRARASRLVLAAYGITYALLVLGMLTNPSSFGAGPIGAVVLTFVLGLALAISLWAVRRSKGHGADASAMVITGMLAVPVILLVIVAGACLATGLPFHPTTL